MSHTVLSIAGVPVGVEHRSPLDSWNCAGHETGAAPCYTVSAGEDEVQAEWERLNRRFPLGACEGNCLYRKVCLGMLDYGGFLLHAAAVAVDGAGYVFTAPGGTGKSTHAGFWMAEFGPRAVMVNGDKPILRQMDGRFFVCGSPWRGKERLGNGDMVPLRAVCLLERGAVNEVSPTDIDTVLDKIFRQVLMPETPKQVILQLDLLDCLIRQVPVYRLRCNLSKDAAITAYRGINRSQGA
ncbi:MAG: hypothetical protein LIO95_10170 [Clostridiales bacterium]|nr:hypothetical protein [Clostridiales bacterium]